MDLAIATQVSSVISLIALIVIIVARVYINRQRGLKDEIKRVPEGQLSEYLLARKDKFKIPTDKLTRDGVERIASQTIEYRTKLYTYVFWAFVIFLVISAGVLVWSIWFSSENKPISMNECLERSIDVRKECNNAEVMGSNPPQNYCHLEMFAPDDYFFALDEFSVVSAVNKSVDDTELWLSKSLRTHSKSKNRVRMVTGYKGTITCTPKDNRKNCFVQGHIANTSFPRVCVIYKQELQAKLKS